jgi:hypothetical protein
MYSDDEAADTLITNLYTSQHFDRHPNSGFRQGDQRLHILSLCRGQKHVKGGSMMNNTAGGRAGDGDKIVENRRF